MGRFDNLRRIVEVRGEKFPAVNLIFVAFNKKSFLFNRSEGLPWKESGFLLDPFHLETEEEDEWDARVQTTLFASPDEIGSWYGYELRGKSTTEDYSRLADKILGQLHTLLFLRIGKNPDNQVIEEATNSRLPDEHKFPELDGIEAEIWDAAGNLLLEESQTWDGVLLKNRNQFFWYSHGYIRVPIEGIAEHISTSHMAEILPNHFHAGRPEKTQVLEKLIVMAPGQDPTPELVQSDLSFIKIEFESKQDVQSLEYFPTWELFSYLVSEIEVGKRSEALRRLVSTRLQKLLEGASHLELFGASLESGPSLASIFSQASPEQGSCYFLDALQDQSECFSLCHGLLVFEVDAQEVVFYVEIEVYDQDGSDTAPLISDAVLRLNKFVWQSDSVNDDFEISPDDLECSETKFLCAISGQDWTKLGLNFQDNIAPLGSWVQPDRIRVKTRIHHRFDPAFGNFVGLTVEEKYLEESFENFRRTDASRISAGPYIERLERQASDRLDWTVFGQSEERS